jgi:hypothetical protein
MKATKKALNYHLPSPGALKDFLALHAAYQIHWRAWLERESIRLDRSLLAPVVALLSAAAALIGVTFVIRLPEITAQNEEYETARQDFIELQGLIREAEEAGADIGQDLRDSLTREPLEAFSYFENAASSLWLVAISFVCIAGLVFCNEWFRCHKAAQYAAWLSAIDAAIKDSKASAPTSNRRWWRALSQRRKPRQPV